MDEVLVEKYEVAAPGSEPVWVATDQSREKAKPKPKHKGSVAEIAGNQKIEASRVDNLVHEIESLPRDRALQFVGDFEDNSEENFFVLGGLLALIKANKWYGKSFDTWVQENTKLARSTAYAYAKAYDTLSKLKVDWSTIDHPGWTKLRTIAPVVNDKNVNQWLARAKSENRAALMHMVEEALRHQRVGSIDGSPAPEKLIFKGKGSWRSDIESALAKAREKSNAKNDNEALLTICREYTATPSLTVRLQQLGKEKAFTALNEAFPDDSLLDDEGLVRADGRPK